MGRVQSPLFVRLVRPVTAAERRALEAGLRSPVAFTRRRAQVLLAGARGERTPAIAAALGCSDRTVRNAIGASDARGAAALTPGSRRPHTPRPAFDAAATE